MAKTATDQPTSGEDSFAPPGRVLIVDQERAALKFYATVLRVRVILSKPASHMKRPCAI